MVLSNYTNAWQLYLGVFFVLLVMLAPGGIAGLLMQFVHLLRHRKLRKMAQPLLLVGVAAALMLFGFVVLVEMLYHLSLNARHGTTLTLAGWMLDTAQPFSWLTALLPLALGALLWWRVRPRLQQAWTAVNLEIENAMQVVP